MDFIRNHFYAKPFSLDSHMKLSGKPQALRSEATKCHHYLNSREKLDLTILPHRKTGPVKDHMKEDEYE